MTRRAHTVMDSPVGPLTLVAADGELCGLYMAGQRHRPSGMAGQRHRPSGMAGQRHRPSGMAGQRHRPSGMAGQRHRPYGEIFGEADAGAFAEAIEQLEEYFAGSRTQFDLPLAPVGTEFQQRVWRALLSIPYGRTVTYGQIAAQIASPAASRAVGLANGRNPIGIIVPCHRVVGSTGRLTGYGGGLDRKQFLLDFEREVASGQ